MGAEASQSPSQRGLPRAACPSAARDAASRDAKLSQQQALLGAAVCATLLGFLGKKQGPEFEPHVFESQSLASHDRKSTKGGRLNPTVGPFVPSPAEVILRGVTFFVKIVIRSIVIKYFSPEQTEKRIRGFGFCSDRIGNEADGGSAPIALA